eukprot:scaffold14900_cov136-Skeletonema_dohrnii-CCMP3373.AAC.2
MALTLTQTCGIVGLICSLLNLFGDICFMDFYLAHMNFDGFGSFDHTSRPGNFFNFQQERHLRRAQATGWMYPIWAVSTSLQLYVGTKSFLPCALLAYGLCIVGGNLHSGFAFATVLPQVTHKLQSDDTLFPNEADFYQVMSSAQKEIMNPVFGYTPGPPAAYIVLTEQTEFSKWCILFTPLVTVSWVAAIGFLLMPMPWGLYFAGSFGTWIILVMNLAATIALWNLDDADAYTKINSD